MSARILLVEDNADLAAGVRHNLELEGYGVEIVEDGAAALGAVERALPDLLILDVMLPGRDGFEILAAIRERGIRTPVLMLTARGEEADKVRAFRLDADQYLTKPFGLLELLERVRSLLRRNQRADTAHAAELRRFGDVEVDVVARKVTRSGDVVPLTPRAFDLLVALMDREGRVTTRQELLRQVWGHLGAVMTRTVDSHVSELRQKLEADPDAPRHILTVWKKGYRFER